MARRHLISAAAADAPERVDLRRVVRTGARPNVITKINPTKPKFLYHSWRLVY
jgi:hypothetical protein